MYLYIHRKDLRGRDLQAFDALQKRNMPGIHLFIIDSTFVEQARLTTFSGHIVLQSIVHLQQEYRSASQTLHLLQGDPLEIVSVLLDHHPIVGIVVQADFTPYAKQRDSALQRLAEQRGVGFRAFDDGPLIHLEHFYEIRGKAEPYRVFTPFYRAWANYREQYGSGIYRTTIADLQTVASLHVKITERYSLRESVRSLLEDVAGTLSSTGQHPLKLFQAFAQHSIQNYAAERNDYAAQQSAGSSGIARWVNTGVVSPRELAALVAEFSHSDSAEPWIRQLCWRDFYLMQARMNDDYFSYEQRFDFADLTDRHFEAWAEGRTGIPIIDAAMKQLNTTGELPNRLRMVVAMFLTKNLQCPFTLGEAYFRRTLIDYDNTLNRGGWLWSSSLGYDAAPYFRIMNPVTQSTNHDPNGDYIRRWLPERSHLSTKEIHLPDSSAIVDLKQSRAAAIELYKRILQ